MDVVGLILVKFQSAIIQDSHIKIFISLVMDMVRKGRISSTQYLLLLDYKGALYDFTLVAGKIPMPPRYTFGIFYSRYWAYSDIGQMVMQNLNESRGMRGMYEAKKGIERGILKLRNTVYHHRKWLMDTAVGIYHWIFLSLIWTGT